MSDEPGPGDAGLAAEHGAAPDAVASLYDTWAVDGAYDRDVESWGYEAPERVAAIVAGALEDGDGDVLDAGCGTGRVGVALASAGLTGVIGGDFTPESVRAAEQRGVYAEVRHLDLNERLDFDDDRFDATVSVGVFSYLVDTGGVVDELLRIVRRGGVVVFTQRTDLWDERDCDRVIADRVERGDCTASISEPMPYLPGHPEFTDVIGIRYVTLTKR